jgi:predicted unusual protein kinase regulating ubiquinone biosynthesis (AarF/ABC1/UbiB family)
MDVNLSELMAALPADDASSMANADWAQEQLREILADLAQRPAPVGSLHRLWTLSELSAQIALAYLALWIRRWFENADAGKRRLMETNLRMALKTFHRLGYLRGAMAKLGQAAGNMPGILPGQVADTLDRLHFEAPPMHYPLIREVVRNEFGKESEEVFLSFEKEAFAAASLGQVHRARLKSGEPVAVKIQYPGIARTIDADFRNLSALVLPLRLGKDWDSVKAQFEEIRRMLNQEVDYLQEAESQRLAHELFRPDDGIVVPRVYPEYSGKRVLTTDYVQGLHLPDYLATNPTQASRNAFGTKIYIAWMRMYYAFMTYADPHPGNYLFLSDGRLALIDFGCVQHYGPEEREMVRLADKMAYEDPSLTREVVQRACGIAANDPELEDYVRIMEESLDWMMEPVRQPGAFDFGDEAHFQRGVDWFSRVVRKRHIRAQPMYVYWNRSVFGLKALLYRLRAQVDVHAVIRQERPAPPRAS